MYSCIARRTQKSDQYITNTNFFTTKREKYSKSSNKIPQIQLRENLEPPKITQEIPTDRKETSPKTESDKKRLSLLQFLSNMKSKRDLNEKRVSDTIIRHTFNSLPQSQTQFRFKRHQTELKFHHSYKDAEKKNISIKKPELPIELPQVRSRTNLRQILGKSSESIIKRKPIKIIEKEEKKRENESPEKDFVSGYNITVNFMYKRHGIPEEAPMLQKLEVFRSLQQEFLQKNPKFKAPFSKQDQIPSQVKIDPHLQLFQSPEESQSSSYLNSALKERKNRLKNIYKRVLYPAGDETARELYKQYFDPSGKVLKLGEFEKALHLEKRKLLKVELWNN